MKITEHLTAAARAISAQLPDGLMIGGAGLVSYGVGLVYAPAGWIIAGIFLLAAGWLLAKGSQ